MELSDTKKSFDKFFTVVNDTYAPYKKFSLREIKLKRNPWRKSSIYKWGVQLKTAKRKIRNFKNFKSKNYRVLKSYFDKPNKSLTP